MCNSFFFFFCVFSDYFFHSKNDSDIYLHRDKTLMPRRESAWSAWNFLGNNTNGVCLTYWLNVLQVNPFSFYSDCVFAS